MSIEGSIGWLKTGATTDYRKEKGLVAEEIMGWGASTR
jgi:hypothetical protein